MSPSCLARYVTVGPLEGYVVVHVSPVSERIREHIVGVISIASVVIVDIFVRLDAILVVSSLWRSSPRKLQERTGSVVLCM